MTLEAITDKASLWKSVIDSMKDLVNEANFEFSPAGITIQSMDSAHVALVALGLGASGFKEYQCFRQRILGINLSNLSKVLKVIDPDDTLAIRHEEDTDILSLSANSSKTNKSSEYQMKLMEIEMEAMGVPEMDYAAYVSMPSEVFSRVMRDMTIFGESVTMEVTKDRVKFSGSSDIGDGSVTLEAAGPYLEGQEAPISASVKEEKSSVKKEKVKAEPVDNSSSGPVPEVKKEIPEEGSPTGRGKKPKMNEESGDVYVKTSEPLQLTFALKYLSIFAKGSTLSNRVLIALSKDAPCRIQYQIEQFGYLRWFLAPKVDDAE